MPTCRHRWRERLGSVTPSAKPSLWLHAVSMGEARAAAPLIRSLKATYPTMVITVTTTTATGAAQIEPLVDSQVEHFYAPYDLPDVVGRFLSRRQVTLCVIMETEIWPNWLAVCHQRGIPIVLANARLSKRSYRHYHWARFFVKPLLNYYSGILARSDQDAEHFLQLGADRAIVNVAGDIKFDLSLPEGLSAAAQALRKNMGHRPVWVAASTHEGEEEIILAAFAQLKQEFSDLLLVLVPRHPERFPEVFELCKEANDYTQEPSTETDFVIARRSLDEPIQQTTDILLGDTIGELLLFYALSDLALVGGSLVPIGGHNLIEPAALGKPIITGQHMGNFKALTAKLLTIGGLCIVYNQASLVTAVKDLLEDPEDGQAMGAAAAALVSRNKGSLKKHVLFIEKLFPNTER